MNWEFQIRNNLGLTSLESSPGGGKQPAFAFIRVLQQLGSQQGNRMGSGKDKFRVQEGNKQERARVDLKSTGRFFWSFHKD